MIRTGPKFSPSANVLETLVEPYRSATVGPTPQQGKNKKNDLIVRIFPHDNVFTSNMLTFRSLILPVFFNLFQKKDQFSKDTKDFIHQELITCQNKLIDMHRKNKSLLYNTLADLVQFNPYPQPIHTLNLDKEWHRCAVILWYAGIENPTAPQKNPITGFNKAEMAKKMIITFSKHTDKEQQAICQWIEKKFHRSFIDVIKHYQNELAIQLYPREQILEKPILTFVYGKIPPPQILKKISSEDYDDVMADPEGGDIVTFKPTLSC